MNQKQSSTTAEGIALVTAKEPLQTGRVSTEGDDLFYEVRGGSPGEKPALLMIPPGGGDGWHYSWTADLLADEYRVITFDRRANGRSTMNAPQNFEISQQSRDAAAVLRAVGETSAFVFGNSSGAVIALDMAVTQPQAVRAVIAHEPPLARLHPNAKKWQRFFANVYAMGFTVSPSLAALRFMLGAELPVRKLIGATKGVNAHRAESSEPYIDNLTATEVLVKMELLPVTNYLPDVARIKQSGVPVIIAVGEWGKERKAWYVASAQALAEQLGSQLITFPGHHGAFLDTPAEFATALRNLLKKV